MRVLARLLFAIAGGSPPVARAGGSDPVHVGVIMEPNAIDRSSSRHYTRLGDKDLCECRLGLVVERLKLANLSAP
jgi:hypothetical protein